MKVQDEALPVDNLRRVRDIGSADIVIGIPSYNNAATIGHVVRAAQAGLAKYFPGYRSVVVNSDGGSRDGTPDVVRGVGGRQASGGYAACTPPSSWLGLLQTSAYLLCVKLLRFIEAPAYYTRALGFGKALAEN